MHTLCDNSAFVNPAGQLYTLLKVVGYYDLSVLSMLVRGFQKKCRRGVGGWVSGVSSIKKKIGIFLTLQSPLDFFFFFFKVGLYRICDGWR